MIKDEYFWLSEINKATVVVNTAAGLLDRETACEAARAVAQLDEEAQSDTSLRVKSYIAYEPLLIKRSSPAITIMHAGRSSQDILSTQRAAILREGTLAFAKALEGTVEKLLKLADRHRDTVVPNYTNGVAAQPNSYAHYLLGIVHSLLRERDRLGEFLVRLNECAMGATVLNGTGWPLDRDAMASHLGFDRPRRNAFDCTCLSPVDMPLEFASIAGAVAVRCGSMINDIMVQYAQPRPWIILQEGGENTYVSSAMPQKRNPGLMNNCREDCSDVIGEMQTAFTRAHNVVPGMVDGKNVTKNNRMIAAACAMLARFCKVLDALVINRDRALEELNLDWTASQEIADRLMKDHGLPFRIGHHMASRMVSHARANNILPRDFPYETMQRIYRDEIEAEFPSASPVLPMSKEEFEAALDPRGIVARRRTAGSAAPAEVDAMITESRQALADAAAAREAFEARLAAAHTALETAFRAFL